MPPLDNFRLITDGIKQDNWHIAGSTRKSRGSAVLVKYETKIFEILKDGLAVRASAPGPYVRTSTALLRGPKGTKPAVSFPWNPFFPFSDCPSNPRVSPASTRGDFDITTS